MATEASRQVKEGAQVSDVRLVGPEKPGAQREALEDGSLDTRRSANGQFRRTDVPFFTCLLLLFSDFAGFEATNVGKYGGDHGRQWVRGFRS